MERVLSKSLSCLTICSQHAKLFSSTAFRKSNYDVIISGGGMVGMAMTSALGNCPQLADKKILMLEGGPAKVLNEPPAEYSSRTVALSPSTIQLLTEIGAWEHVENMRCQPVKLMQVWDSCSDSLISFNRQDLMDELACIAENDIVQEGIRRSMDTAGDGVEVRYESKVKGYTLPAAGSEGDLSWAQIHMESGETLKTRLLIGADGFRSLVRQTANIHTLQWNYDQMAVVATLKLSEATENNVAWQRFKTTGPVALLPLSPDYSCLIWSTTPEDAKNLLQLDHDSFIDAVNSAFWSDDEKDPSVGSANRAMDDALSSIGLESRPLQQLPPTMISVDKKSIAAFPLGFLHSSHYAVPRMALIGDAAHRCHPMAGQGVNMGFGDVSCLRDELSAAATRGADLGSFQHLLNYETIRQRHVVPTLFGIDALYRLYRASSTPVVLARSLGLQVTNSLKPLKSLFMDHAMR